MVSVIVPIYNVEKYIEECLGSIENQTLNKKEYEVILINDCSTDNSLEKAQKFVERNKNFKLINNKNNMGLSRTRNVGIKAISKNSKRIFFIDSDDYISENFLEELSIIDTKLHVGVAISKSKTELKEVKVVEPASAFPIKGYVWIASWHNKDLFSDDIRNYEDFYYTCKNSKNMEVKIHSSAKYFYRLNDSGITQTKMTEVKINDYLKELKRLYDLALESDELEKNELLSWINNYWVTMLVFSKWSGQIKRFFKEKEIVIEFKYLRPIQKVFYLFVKCRISKLLIFLTLFSNIAKQCRR